MVDFLLAAREFIGGVDGVHPGAGPLHPTYGGPPPLGDQQVHIMEVMSTLDRQVRAVELRQLTGEDAGIYTVLNRMERRGLIWSEVFEQRRVYALTDLGRRTYRTMIIVGLLLAAANPPTFDPATSSP